MYREKQRWQYKRGESFRKQWYGGKPNLLWMTTYLFNLRENPIVTTWTWSGFSFFWIIPFLFYKVLNLGNTKKFSLCWYLIHKKDESEGNNLILLLTAILKKRIYTEMRGVPKHWACSNVHSFGAYFGVLEDVCACSLLELWCSWAWRKNKVEHK